MAKMKTLFSGRSSLPIAGCDDVLEVNAHINHSRSSKVIPIDKEQGVTLDITDVCPNGTNAGRLSPVNLPPLPVPSSLRIVGESEQEGGDMENPFTILTTPAAPNTTEVTKTETKESDFGEDLLHLFPFRSPLLFYKTMQLVLLFNCFYLSAYFVYFIRAAYVTLDNPFTQIALCPLPCMIVMCVLSPIIIQNYSILTAIAQLNKDRLQDVVKHTAHYRKSHALDNFQSCVDDLDMSETDVMMVIDKLRIRGKSLRQLGKVGMEMEMEITT